MIVNHFNFNKNLEKYFNFCFFLFHGPNFSKVSSLTNDFKAKIEKLDKKFTCKITYNNEDISKFPNFLNDELLNLNIFGEKKILVCDLINPEILVKHFEFEKNIEKKLNFKLLIRCNELKKNNKIRKLFESNHNFISVACYEDSEFECEIKVKEVLKKNNINASDEVIKLVSSFLLKNNTIFNQELEKIMIYLKNKKNINCKELVSIITNGSIKFNIDELVYSIVSGDVKKFDKLLNEYNLNNTSEISIINSVTKHLYKLLYAKSNLNKYKSYETALKIIKPPIFFKKKKEFVDQLNFWTEEKIQYFLVKLLELEISIKKNNHLPREYYKSLLFSITKTANSFRKSLRSPF